MVSDIACWLFLLTLTRTPPLPSAVPFLRLRLLRNRLLLKHPAYSCRARARRTALSCTYGVGTVQGLNLNPKPFGFKGSGKPWRGFGVSGFGFRVWFRIRQDASAPNTGRSLADLSGALSQLASQTTGLLSPLSPRWTQADLLWSLSLYEYIYIYIIGH